eukprot:TRINITY_DN11316_c0_g1_i1.p1 TRINITY_DN11316_c0_g1~~TRINITY_DN11316_c0_g1_i1.p1  ORF type:complete len:472 (+),score=102.47 TRINITY_DN11316_c0_g1_i1:72-1487(+)
MTEFDSEPEAGKTGVALEACLNDAADTERRLFWQRGVERSQTVRLTSLNDSGGVSAVPDESSFACADLERQWDESDIAVITPQTPQSLAREPAALCSLLTPQAQTRRRRWESERSCQPMDAPGRCAEDEDAADSVFREDDAVHLAARVVQSMLEDEAAIPEIDTVCSEHTTSSGQHLSRLLRGAACQDSQEDIREWCYDRFAQAAAEWQSCDEELRDDILRCVKAEAAKDMELLRRQVQEHVAEAVASLRAEMSTASAAMQSCCSATFEQRIERLVDTKARSGRDRPTSLPSGSEDTAEAGLGAATSPALKRSCEEDLERFLDGRIQRLLETVQTDIGERFSRIECEVIAVQRLAAANFGEQAQACSKSSGGGCGATRACCCSHAEISGNCSLGTIHEESQEGLEEKFQTLEKKLSAQRCELMRALSDMRTRLDDRHGGIVRAFSAVLGLLKAGPEDQQASRTCLLTTLVC